MSRFVKLRRQQIALAGGRKPRRRERYARAGAPVQCGHSRPALSLCDGVMSRVTDHLKVGGAYLPSGSSRPPAAFWRPRTQCR